MTSSISNQAPTFGHIETSYKQSEITRTVFEEYGVRTKATDSGVCMAMSAEYLTKSAQGEDFYAWLADSSSKWQVLSQYLDEGYQALPPPEAQARIQDGLKTSLNHVGTVNLSYDDFTPELLAQAMSMASDDSKGSYNMCYLLMPNGGPGHAVACIKDENDHIRFMDPNIGELSFESTTEFENWMCQVFDKHYSSFSHMSTNLYESPTPAPEAVEPTFHPGQMRV